MTRPTDQIERDVFVHADREGECLVWRRGCTTGGYGVVYFNGREKEYVHRAVLEWSIGRKLVKGEMACHTCDNRRCCDPEHLYAGNARTNGRDMVERGRAAWQKDWEGWASKIGRPGDLNAQTRLPDAKVEELEREYAAGVKQSELAKRYGVSPALVCMILKGKRRAKRPGVVSMVEGAVGRAAAASQRFAE